jgi:hypothetical protein
MQRKVHTNRFSVLVVSLFLLLVVEEYSLMDGRERDLLDIIRALVRVQSA